jgi:hypothetical protein
MCSRQIPRVRSSDPRLDRPRVIEPPIEPIAVEPGAPERLVGMAVACEERVVTGLSTEAVSTPIADEDVVPAAAGEAIAAAPSKRRSAPRLPKMRSLPGSP